MRFVCDVLEEMRKCYKTYNFSCIASLIEELQSLVNRMEATLEERKSYFYWKDLAKEKEDEIEQLNKKIKELKNKVKLRDFGKKG